MEEIKFDRQGRMLYNPIYHSKSKRPWSREDLQYLIDWYDIIGAEEMSFALERTITTVQNKVYELRKKGLASKPPKRKRHERNIKKEMA